jgi:hypothetical protein
MGDFTDRQDAVAAYVAAFKSHYGEYTGLI